MNDKTLPNAEVAKDNSISPMWILPILSLCLAGWLLFKAINDAGTRISIQFETADGLVAGRTPIKFKGLEIGMVKQVELNEDFKGITVLADIYPQAQHTLNEDSQFWLVQPQATLEGVSGLDTLVTGNYIAVLPGSSSNSSTEYTALDVPPNAAQFIDGQPVTLTTPTLNGVSVGSKIYYRRIPVGEVVNYQLATDNQSVRVDAVIHSPYESLLNGQSRFWNISGIRTEIGLKGVDIQLEGLSTLILGGIAFDSPPEGQGEAVLEQYRLYEGLKEAERGIAITIALPENHQLPANGGNIVYRDLPIGEIRDINLPEVAEDKQGIVDADQPLLAVAFVSPSFSHLLTAGSKLYIEEAQLSFDGIKNPANIVLGNYLRLEQGQGEPTTHFVAMRSNDQFYDDTKNIAVSLTSQHSHDLKRGTPVKHRGIEVGKVSSVMLNGDNVDIGLIIASEYATLIRNQNRFYLDGGIQAKIDSEGLNVDIKPFSRLISPSISFTQQGDNYLAKDYPLYASKQAAELAVSNSRKRTRIGLVHEKNPGVKSGSPLLYKDIQVGEVVDLTLVGDVVHIDVDIEERYQHLINNQSVFWSYSGVKIDAGLTGVNIETGPLTTLIKGGIAFHTQSGIDNKSQGRYRLFDNEKSAKLSGYIVTLTSSTTQAVNRTTPIRYKGVTVGEVKQVRPEFERGDVAIDAVIYPDYVDHIARADSYFWIVKPKLSLTQSENLESLLTTYIAVEPGESELELIYAQLNDAPSGRQGLTVFLQAEFTYDISVGSPVLFRQLQVGEVTGVELGELADRVDIKLTIYDNYQHLVRTNSVFWNQSGLEFNLGFTGASLQAGTLDSILKGGITFATPPTGLGDRAKKHSVFLLHGKPEPEWKSWRTAIPR